MCAYPEQCNSSLQRFQIVWACGADVLGEAFLVTAYLLFDEHAISIGIEPVASLYRMAVCVHYQFFSAERAHQHQQRRLRQMEVCQQRVHDAKAIAGIDEYVCLALSGFHAIVSGACGSILQGSNGGCAHRYYAPVLSFRSIDCSRRFFRDFVPLSVQFVVFYLLYSYRLKGPESDVQSDLGNFNSSSTNLLKDLWSEVQPGCRRRH
jgi:hypothetical protein